MRAGGLAFVRLRAVFCPCRRSNSHRLRQTSNPPTQPGGFFFMGKTEQKRPPQPGKCDGQGRRKKSPGAGNREIGSLLGGVLHAVSGPAGAYDSFSEVAAALQPSDLKTQHGADFMLKGQFPPRRNALTGPNETAPTVRGPNWGR
jgi:hypothetical protein